MFPTVGSVTRVKNVSQSIKAAAGHLTFIDVQWSLNISDSIHWLS